MQGGVRPSGARRPVSWLAGGPPVPYQPEHLNRLGSGPFDQVSFVRQEAQFLVHFTQYRLQVFTGAEMPCCTDVNATRLHLLAVRPPLEKYQSIAVDDPQMERAVPLAPRVHHSPGEYLTGRLAVLVQHVKQFSEFGI